MTLPNERIILFCIVPSSMLNGQLCKIITIIRGIDCNLTLYRFWALPLSDFRTLTVIIGDNFPKLSFILFIIVIYILLALDRLCVMGGVVSEGESLRPYL